MVRWLKNRKLRIIIILILTFISIFIANIIGVRMKLARLKTQLERRGELVDIENLVQKQNVENELAIKQLDGYLLKLSHTPEGVWQIYEMDFIKPGKAKISWKQDEFISDESKRFTWPYLFKRWESKRECIEQISLVLTQTNLVRHLDYHKGLEFWEDYQRYRLNGYGIDWLQFAVVCQLHYGNLRGTLKDLICLIRFNRLSSKE